MQHAYNLVLFVIFCFMFQTARKIYVPMLTVFSVAVIVVVVIVIVVIVDVVFLVVVVLNVDVVV